MSWNRNRLYMYMYMCYVCRQHFHFIFRFPMQFNRSSLIVGRSLCRFYGCIIVNVYVPICEVGNYGECYVECNEWLFQNTKYRHTKTNTHIENILFWWMTDISARCLIMDEIYHFYFAYNTWCNIPCMIQRQQAEIYNIRKARYIIIKGLNYFPQYQPHQNSQYGRNVNI